MEQWRSFLNESQNITREFRIKGVYKELTIPKSAYDNHVKFTKQQLKKYPDLVAMLKKGTSDKLNKAFKKLSHSSMRNLFSGLTGPARNIITASLEELNNTYIKK